MIFDTHAHYDDEAFDEDREDILSSLKANNISYVTNIGASMASSRMSLDLAKKYNFIFAAIGVHPNEVEELDEAKIEWLRENASHSKVVAIGEIGLDYYWNEPSADIQKKWFERQLDLAREVKLPVVIHSRDAAKDTMDIMKYKKAQEIGGVIHCYSYHKEQAKEYLDMGFYFGIGGVVTFNNAKKLREVVEFLPMDRIVLETDAPYLSPVPNRGKRNSSLNLPYVVKEIAGIKGISEKEVIDITRVNAKTLYRLGI